MERNTLNKIQDIYIYPEYSRVIGVDKRCYRRNWIFRLQSVMGKWEVGSNGLAGRSGQVDEEKRRRRGRRKVRRKTR